MKERLLEYLACPDCRGALALRGPLQRAAGGTEDPYEAGEILEGELICTVCTHGYPIRRGVPRLLPRALGHLAVEVAESFAWEWSTFDELRPEYHSQFLDWVRPLTPADFAGRVVVEGGCGKGRHTALVAGYGAREVLALDLGSVVDVAQRNAGRAATVHIIQGDVTRPPLRRGCADLAFSVGVLHHLEAPTDGFRALFECVRPGGRIAVWVYGREGNEWIVNVVDPLRERLTARLPRRLLYELSRPLAVLVGAAAKGVYRPTAVRGGWAGAVHRRLPYAEYLTYIARLPARELHSIVFDHLVTPVAHYLPRSEVAAWFRDPRLTDVMIEQHNGNSWRAQARVVGR